jgi:hypothetical protein
MIRKPPGAVAILRASVVTAGADVEAVDAWVTEHRGAIKRTDPVRLQGRRRGRSPSAPCRASLYYLLPREAV